MSCTLLVHELHKHTLTKPPSKDHNYLRTLECKITAAMLISQGSGYSWRAGGWGMDQAGQAE